MAQPISIPIITYKSQLTNSETFIPYLKKYIHLSRLIIGLLPFHTRQRRYKSLACKFHSQGYRAFINVNYAPQHSI